MSQRRGVTLLELLIVAILLMGMIGTVTSFLSYMPHWSNVINGKLNLMREESSASSMLQGEIAAASSCACVNPNKAVMTNAATGDPWEYYLVAHPGNVPDRYEMRASKDGGSNYIKVAGMVKSFTCTERPTYNGVDLCVVYETNGLLRRETLQFRRSTPRTMEIDLADLDRDGFKDLVTVRPAATVVQTYKGASNGTWSTHVTVNLNAESQPRSIEVVDFDGNGKLDLAVLTTKDVQILEAEPSLITNPLVNGIMSYSVTQTIALPSGAGPVTMASGDLDNDGATDLVVTDTAIRGVRLLYGQTTNKLRFNTPVRWPLSPTTLPGIPRRVRVAHMNTGSFRDLVIGLNSPTVAGQSVAIALGNGTRSTYFAAAVPYSGGVESWDLDVGDIDLDGDLDVVSADWTRDRLARMLNSGAGVLGLPAYTTTVSPTSVAFLEWNGTTPVDVASVTRVRGSATAVHVFPGPSLGTTVSSTHFPVSNVDGISIVTANVSATNHDTWATAWMTPDPGGVRFETSPNEKSPPSRDLAIADVNRDGRDDLITVYSLVSAVVVTPGSATDPFLDDASKASYALAGTVTPVAVRCADLNRDGKQDAVVATQTNVQVLLGNGTGFGAASTYTAGTQPQSLAIGDFNRDGIPDAAVTDAGQARVSILIGNGSGGFNAPAHITLGQASYPIALVDLNRDGIQDLVIGHRAGTNVLSVLTGVGDGTFNTPATYAAGASSDALAVGDFTRDGYPDVVTAARGTNTVRVIPGSTTTPGTLNTGSTASSTTDAPAALVTLYSNADPFPDLAVVNKRTSGVSQVTVFNGSASSPWLTAQTPVDIETNGFAIAAANLNRDGRDDWVAQWMSGSGSLFWSKGLAPAQTRAGTLNLTNKTEHNLTGDLRRKLVGLAAGDYDRDGKGDFVVATEYEQGGTKSGVITFYGVGNLTFTGATHQRIANGILLNCETADYNRDGILDLTVSSTTTGALKIIMATGNGNRSTPWAGGGSPPEWLPGGAPNASEFADYNRDGKLDFLAATSTLYAVGKGDATGAVAASSTYSLTFASAITAADLDRNGTLDLLTTVGPANQLRVRLHDGTANDNPYGSESSSYSMGNGAAAVAVGDFNLDGIPDVVTANPFAGTLTVRTGTGTGTFNAIGTGQTITTSAYPRKVRVADMNMDGKPDLVACGDGNNTTAGKVWISIGVGDGTFGAATAYTVANNPWDIRVLDFNQDDRPDVVVSHNTDVTSGGGGNPPPVARVWVIPGN